MSRCLVVGGNGFIGSHIVDALSDRGHDITVFDRFSDGHVRYKSKDVRTITGDFLNTGDLTAALLDQEVVLHLLSTSTPATAEADPLLDVRTNLTGGVELFRLAAEAGVQHVYFASTGGAIYGDTDLALIHETVTPRPISPYAIGKLALEGYLEYFRRTTGLDYTVLRLSNPFGPRQSPSKRQGVIPIFLRQLLADRPVTVFGNGTMARDYIYVEDAAQMFARSLDLPKSHSLYNIGSGRSTSINEIVNTINRVTGKNLRVENVPPPPTFVHSVALDISRFESDFGPTTTLTGLDEGISRTWHEMRP